MDWKDEVNSFWEKEGRKNQIKIRLDEIDDQSVRPLRAGEREKLAKLESEAESLRQELRELDS